MRLDTREMYYLYHVYFQGVRLPSLVIRELQVKTTMRYHFTPSGVAIVLKVANKLLAKVWRNWSLMPCWWDCKMILSPWKIAFQFLSRLTYVKLPRDPSIVVLGIYSRKLKRRPHKNLYMNVQSSITYNS